MNDSNRKFPKVIFFIVVGYDTVWNHIWSVATRRMSHYYENFIGLFPHRISFESSRWQNILNLNEKWKRKEFDRNNSGNPLSVAFEKIRPFPSYVHLFFFVFLIFIDSWIVCIHFILITKMSRLFKFFHMVPHY